MPVLGTCAGMIVHGPTRSERRARCSALLDIAVRRNAYGRQVDSFEADVDVEGVDSAGPGVFIRAPRGRAVGDGVEVLAEHDGNRSCWYARATCSRRLPSRSSPASRGCTEAARAPASGRCEPSCPAIRSGRRSSGRRAPPTPSGASCSRKLLRAVEVAAREGGGSVEGNMTLASAVEKAETTRCPRQHRARHQAGRPASRRRRPYEEVTYEGYGPGRRGDPGRGPDRQPEPHRRRTSATCSPRAAATWPSRQRRLACSTAQG